LAGLTVALDHVVQAAALLVHAPLRHLFGDAAREPHVLVVRLHMVDAR
jgi:hypothetical protein